MTLLAWSNPERWRQICRDQDDIDYYLSRGFNARGAALMTALRK